MTAFSGKFYSASGIHLNKIRKQILSSRILREIQCDYINVQNFTPPLGDHKWKTDTLTNLNHEHKLKKTTVINKNMRDINEKYRSDSTVAFGHCV